MDLGSKRAGVSAAPTDDAAERRQVTVLFASLGRIGNATDTEYPEDVREAIAAYRQCVAEIVGRYDGHVAQFFGEGILIYFGHPRAHEDDPERAIRAGLESYRASGRPRPGRHAVSSARRYRDGPRHCRRSDGFGQRSERWHCWGGTWSCDAAA